MHITRAYCDNWIGNIDKGEEILNPTLDDIMRLVLSLDGKNKTMVTIGNDDEDFYMCIAGGNDGLYLAHIVYDDNDVFYDLVDLTKSRTKTVELVSGGQNASYEEYLCVSKDKVMKAVKTFYEQVKPDQSLSWQKH